MTFFEIPERSQKVEKSEQVYNMDKSIIRIAAWPDCCALCQRKEDLLFCTPCFCFDLCGHSSCQSCFKLKNRTKEPKSYACPVCMGPYYYSLTSLEEALMIGTGGYYNLCSFRYEIKIGYEILLNSTPQVIKAFPLRVKQMNAFDQLMSLYPDSICGLVYSLCSLDAINIMNEGIQRRTTDDLKGTLFYQKQSEHDTNINKAYKYCMRLLAMTAHESAFLVTEHLDTYYSQIAHAFSSFFNVVTAVKYYKMAYTFALRSDKSLIVVVCKNKLKEEMDKLAVLPPLRFAVGDKVLCCESEGGEWRQCEVVELYYREPDDPLRYCAPYHVKFSASDGKVTGCQGDISSSKGSDEVPVYIIVEDDDDSHIRRPGWISLEAARFEARLDAKVEELAGVYCAPEFIRGIYRTLSDDEDFCGRLHADWKLEVSEQLLHLYRLLVMYRVPLVRTDSGYHIPTAEEVIAGIKSYFYSDTAEGLARKTDSGDSDSSVILKTADSLVFLCPPMILHTSSPSAHMYGDQWLPGGLSAITLTFYFSLIKTMSAVPTT